MRHLRVGILALVLLAVAAPVFADWGTGSAVSSQTKAPDRVGRWDGGVMIGGAFNGDFDDAFYAQSQVAYGITPWVAVGLEIGYQENDGADFNDETVHVLPLLVDVIVRVPTLHETIVPYGVFGLGMTSVWVQDEDGEAPDNNGDDVDDIGIGWKIGGGVDWFFDPNWIANLEAAYFNGDIDLPGSSVNDVGYGTFLCGVKYVN